MSTNPIHDMGWLKTRVLPENLHLELSAVVRKDPAWTPGYIEQVERGNLPASQKLLLAIRKLKEKLQRRVIPPAGTWVPFRSRREQRSVLSRLTGEQRRKALLSAAFKSEKKGGKRHVQKHSVRRRSPEVAGRRRRRKR